MNEITKKIENLRNEISYISFKNFLDDDDYKAIKSKEKEIEALEKELKSYEGVALKLKYSEKVRRYFIDDGFYLSSDPILCCSNEPVWFSSKEEAMGYLEKAQIRNKNEYDLEFIVKEL